MFLYSLVQSFRNDCSRMVVPYEYWDFIWPGLDNPHKWKIFHLILINFYCLDQCCMGIQKLLYVFILINFTSVWAVIVSVKIYTNTWSSRHPAATWSRKECQPPPATQLPATHRRRYDSLPSCMWSERSKPCRCLGSSWSFFAPVYMCNETILSGTQDPLILLLSSWGIHRGVFVSSV